MLEMLSTGNCIGFKVGGELSVEDYQKLTPKMEEAVEAFGTINMVVVFDDFEGWENWAAMKEDFKVGTGQYKNVRRAAFVSDSDSMEKWVKLMDAFTRRTEERTFKKAELEDAWKWACSGD